MATKKATRTQKSDAKTAGAVSVSPSGEVFRLPGPADYAKELARLKVLVAGQRKK
jgi:hypothetical protein